MHSWPSLSFSSHVEFISTTTIIFVARFVFFEIRSFGSSKLGSRNLELVTPYDTSLPYDTILPWDIISPYDTLLSYDNVLFCDTIVPYNHSSSYDTPQPHSIPYPTRFFGPMTFLTLRYSSIPRYLIRVPFECLTQHSKIQPVSACLLRHPSQKIGLVGGSIERNWPARNSEQAVAVKYWKYRQRQRVWNNRSMSALVQAIYPQWYHGSTLDSCFVI